MSERPLVTIGHPTIPSDTPDDPEQGSVEVPEALVLTCSEHGDLTDWVSIPQRAHLRYLARAHAIEVHDEQVDAKGWYW